MLKISSNTMTIETLPLEDDGLLKGKFYGEVMRMTFLVNLILKLYYISI